MPAIEGMTEGEEDAVIESASDALMGGEDPNGEGFEGELLELRREAASCAGAGFRTFFGGGTVGPLPLITAEPVDLGAVAFRGFFTAGF